MGFIILSRIFFPDNQATASPLPLARLQLEEVANTLGNAGGGGDRGMGGGGGAVGAAGSPLSQRSGYRDIAIRRESSHMLADISEDVSSTGEAAVVGGSGVQAIAAMFPTVDEGHIKELLKK